MHQYHYSFVKLWIFNAIGFIFSITDLQSLVGLIAGILNLCVVGYSLYFLHKKAQREDQEQKKQDQEYQQKQQDKTKDNTQT